MIRNLKEMGMSNRGIARQLRCIEEYSKQDAQKNKDTGEKEKAQGIKA